MSTATESTAAAGLRGVVAAQSAIGDVDGEKGILIYQGYDIHDLAENSTFEEVIFLLWNGRLPKADELESHIQKLRDNYAAPAAVIEMMKQFPKESNPMDVLRTAVSSLDFYDAEAHGTDRESATNAAINITGQIGTIAAAWDRIRNGKDIIAPDKSLSIAENFLYMLRGEKPEADEARMFDIALILHADHELNASTFTTRVVAGTLAGMYGAVTAGIAALAGPLHGGANTNVMKMLIEIDDPAKIDASVNERSKQRRRSWASATPFTRRKTRVLHFVQNSPSRWRTRKALQSGMKMSQRIEQLMLEKKGMYQQYVMYLFNRIALIGATGPKISSRKIRAFVGTPLSTVGG